MRPSSHSPVEPMASGAAAGPPNGSGIAAAVPILALLAGSMIAWFQSQAESTPPRIRGLSRWSPLGRHSRTRGLRHGGLRLETAAEEAGGWSGLHLLRRSGKCST